MNYLLVKMGGSGIRFNSDIPKQYIKINGQPLFYWLLRNYESLGLIHGYFLVSNKDWIDYTEQIASRLLGNKLLGVISGGSTMSQSIYNGVMYARRYVCDDDILLIHDVTNPIVAKDMINEVIEAAKEYGFSVLTTEQVHTIYQVNENNEIESVISKQEVTSGYSPEAFVYVNIYDCYSNAKTSELEKMTSAIALAKAHNAKAKAIKTNIVNLKITYKNDLEVYKKLIERNNENGL